MVLELGPWPATEVLQWSKFARRIVVELRCTPEGDELPPPDVINLWSKTLDDWADEASRAAAVDHPFRQTAEFEPEVVEYLLHGLDRCVHSPQVRSWITPEEANRQRAFTMSVVHAFVDGLEAEGAGCREYADHILSSLGGLLED